MSSNPNLAVGPVSTIEKTVVIGLLLTGLGCLVAAGVLVLSAYMFG